MGADRILHLIVLCAAVFVAVPAGRASATHRPPGSCTPGAAEVCAPDGHYSFPWTNTNPQACRFDAMVDWGDGTSTSYPDIQSGQSASHTYTSSGIFMRVSSGSGIALMVGATCTFTGRTVTVEVPAPPPPPPPPPPESERATVGAIKGEVAFRRGTGPWQTLTPGTLLGERDEVFTGIDSLVTLRFADGATVAVNELTQLLIGTLLRANDRINVVIQLRVGEIKAKVQTEKSVDMNFEVQGPNPFQGSVRGTIFRVFVDPGGGAAVVSTLQGVVTVDPVRPGLPTRHVTAGKEIEVTARAISALVPIGKAGARGGVNRARARDLVLGVLDRARARCRLKTPRTPSVASVKPAGRGWLVAVRVTGKVTGTSRWAVAGTRVAPANSVAKKVAAGCR